MLKKIKKISSARRAAPVSRPPLARMMRLHEKLARGEPCNCRRVSGEMEVSGKTIQRDMDFMRDQLGLPVAYDSAKRSFVYTSPVTHFPTVQVTEGELVALFVAQKALVQYRGTPFEKALGTAFQKLTDGLQEEVSFTLAEAEPCFSFHSPGTPLADLSLLEQLGGAVMKRMEISFEYHKLQGEKFELRHVRPYHLACSDNQWYLLGHDMGRESVRTFALPRMRCLSVGVTGFSKPRDFSPAKMLEKSFGIFSGDKSHEIRITFDAFAARLVAEKKWHSSQKIVFKKNGGCELRLTLGSLHEIERWILGWGYHAEVLSPAVLRENICGTIRAMRKVYDGV